MTDSNTSDAGDQLAGVRRSGSPGPRQGRRDQASSRGRTTPVQQARSRSVLRADLNVVDVEEALASAETIEEYFDADVTQRLLDIAREAVVAGVVVDVRNYVAA